MQQLRGLPLMTIVYGWGTPAAEEFLAAVSARLRPLDSYLLIPYEGSGDVPPAPSELEWATVLDVGHDSHRDMIGDPVGDLAFFPAAHESEVESAALAAESARVFIVRADGRHASAVADAGRQRQTAVYFMIADDDLRVAPTASPEDEELSPPRLDQPWLNDVGRELAELAERLADLPEAGRGSYGHYQRPFVTRSKTFRDAIRECVNSVPQHLSWDEDLVFLADRHRWPAWAVECLPRLYVPLGEPAGRTVSALLSHHIYHTLLSRDVSAVVRELCGGRFYLVRVERDAAVFVEDVAPDFESFLQKRESSSENELLCAAVNIASVHHEKYINEGDARQRVSSRVHEHLLREARAPAPLELVG